MAPPIFFRFASRFIWARGSRLVLTPNVSCGDRHIHRRWHVGTSPRCVLRQVSITPGTSVALSLTFLIAKAQQQGFKLISAYCSSGPTASRTTRSPRFKLAPSTSSMLWAAKFSSPLQIVIVLLNPITHRTNCAAGRACNPSLLTISTSLCMQFKAATWKALLLASEGIHRQTVNRYKQQREVRSYGKSRLLRRIAVSLSLPLGLCQ